MCEWARGSAVLLIWATVIVIGMFICYIAYDMLQGYYFLGTCLAVSILVIAVLYKIAKDWQNNNNVV